MLLYLYLSMCADLSAHECLPRLHFFGLRIGWSVCICLLLGHHDETIVVCGYTTESALGRRVHDIFLAGLQERNSGAASIKYILQHHIQQVPGRRVLVIYPRSGKSTAHPRNISPPLMWGCG
ncbi:hypothetical protein BDZ91DRAFT_253400 [Kalaharituber pfeilii]|nr:hypothetical protein BDZ91DRAFT_253400 [Kalaharituber pfeilii]